MRTTVDIDEDVLLAVKERARREKRPAGAVLSDLARQALTAQHRPDPDRRAARHGFAALPRRGQVVSNALIDHLREREPE